MSLPEIDMKQRRISNKLEKIQRMTSEYKDFFATYKRGGDWNMDRFMKEIEYTAKETKELFDGED